MRKRAEKYIHNVIHALESINTDMLRGKVINPIDLENLLRAVRLYADDAHYYLSIGDNETALVAASYAEGLLDALKYMNILELKWPSQIIEKKKVLVAGTFDIIHPGHVELLKFASSLGLVYVVIARDSTVLKLKKRKPILDEKSRLALVSSIKYVYEAVLGDEEDMLKPVELIRPDIILLGPDQAFDEKELAERIAERLGYKPTIIRYPSRIEFSRGLKSSSDIIREACSNLLEQ